MLSQRCPDAAGPSSLCAGIPAPDDRVGSSRRDPADLAGEEPLRLRREVRQLRLERLDPLCGLSFSKAAAWFAQATGTIPSGSFGS